MSCPHLEIASARVSAFAEMLTGRHGERLDAWIPGRSRRPAPLHRFVRGLKRDYAAVLNGLTRPHSSGAAEGYVNRIKMIKRELFGSANFHLRTSGLSTLVLVNTRDRAQRVPAAAPTEHSWPGCCSLPQSALPTRP
ncbi:transposase [Kibdelosporangium aridum]|uniref:transposase n=1 Tax=Kibdelosporangium aridum TaxID=2030 RepID=UPI0035EA1F4B